MLGLGGAVLKGMEERGVHAGKAGQHLGITPVTLAFGAGNGVELARVGDDHGRTEVGEVTADPRTVRARFQGHGRTGKIREQLDERGPRVGQGSLTDNLASRIQHANVMLPIAKIKAESEPADDGSRRSGNNRRSSFIFHRQIIYHSTLHCAERLPSHLILLENMGAESECGRTLINSLPI